MSLPHAILTALLEKPSSGLELTRRFDKSIGFFWPATHQQIYRELAKLEQVGQIQAVPGPPAQGRRKEYEVLPAGRAELAFWTADSHDPKPVRDAMLLRLRAAVVVGTAGLDAEVDRHLDLHIAQLAQYRAIEEHDFPPEKAAGENRLQHLVLQAGIGLETFWVAWLTEVRHALGQPGADGGPVRPVAEADGGPALSGREADGGTAVG